MRLPDPDAPVTAMHGPRERAPARDEQQRSYWDERFAREGRIWGNEPSQTAVMAAELFRDRGVQTVLVPGSGYGRNSRLLSTSGFTVVAVDISPIAIEWARQLDLDTTHHVGSVLDLSFDDAHYDAIYCYNTLHLFYQDERRRLTAECASRLRPEGLAFFTVFSDEDPGFGRGQEVEPNTFESRPGRPAHYFSVDDLLHHFQAFELLETGTIEEREDHGEGPHAHVLRCILAAKP